MVNDITLVSVVEVKEVLKKTRAKMFKDLVKGDFLRLSAPVKNGYSTASYITIENLENNESTTKSFNEVVKVLDCFKLEEVK